MLANKILLIIITMLLTHTLSLYLSSSIIHTDVIASKIGLVPKCPCKMATKCHATRWYAISESHVRDTDPTDIGGRSAERAIIHQQHNRRIRNDALTCPRGDAPHDICGALLILYESGWLEQLKPIRFYFYFIFFVHVLMMPILEEMKGLPSLPL